eukprot:TRINITY_DN112419_c0_g1_i1.p1 TRINITY_DN112419_c0_g1~~TRINITY_DN112419_c0_g1_i1.p1  ORF type:complete len:148 (-),score=17.49 TRINITY_DN112419_c0_g1_i1:208-651(-)
MQGTGINEKPPFSPDCVQTAFMFGAGGGVFGGILSLLGAGLGPGVGGSSWDRLPVGYYYKSLGRQAYRQGKTFGVWGFYFGGLLAMVEKRRGKHDYWNPFIAGGLSSVMPGGMGMGGPKKLAVRVIGGGIFIAALEKVFNWFQGIED